MRIGALVAEGHQVLGHGNLGALSEVQGAAHVQVPWKVWGMETDVKKPLPEGCEPHQWHWCKVCGALVGIGMWPTCHGDPREHGAPALAGKTDVFPFTTSHINGKPMVIESLHHLRQVERNYGVTLTAFSRDRSKWDDTPLRDDLPRFKGNNLEYRD